MKKRLLLFVALFLSLMIVQHQEIHAASTKEHGIVQKVEGEATYQSGASFNKTPLSISQKWESGDLIRTKKAASVEVNMQGTGDTFYIGENAEVYFTYENKNIYLHVLKGNVYVAAEKRDNENEALFIISGKEKFEVLGTHFTIGVDPVTGLVNMFVHSGVVGTDRPSAGDSEIYPGYQMTPNGTVPTPVDLEDINQLINQIDSSIIEALLRNIHEIDQENEQTMEQLREQLRNQGHLPDSLSHLDEDALSRLQTNLDNLVANIVREAIENNIVNRDAMEELIRQVNERNPERPINLDNIPLLNRPDLSDAQQRAKEAEERRKKLLEEQQERQRQVREEQQNRNQDLLDRLAQERENQAQRQKEEMEKRAEEARNRLEEERRPTPPPRPTPPKEPEYEKLEVSAVQDGGQVYVTLEDYDPDFQYELWINNERIDLLEVYFVELDVAQFIIGENKLEIFKISEGKKVGYGQITVEIESEWDFEERLVILRTNPTSIYLYWNPPIDDRERLTLEVYNIQQDSNDPSDPDGREPVFIAEGHEQFVVIVDELYTNTNYKVVEKMHGIVINEIQFVTKTDVEIDYSGDMISWKIPRGPDGYDDEEEITFDVYVNGNLEFVKDSRTSYAASDLINPAEDGEWVIKVDLFVNEEPAQSYESTFKTLAPIPD